LDIGCGTGEFSEYLKKTGNEIIGIEITDICTEICKKKGLQVITLDIEKYTLPDLGQFDFILMLEVIEHLIDPLPVLRDKIRKLLKKDGSLIISTINCVAFKFRLSLLLGNLPDFGENKKSLEEYRPYNLHHKSLFTINSLLKVLKLAGFNIVTRFESTANTPSKLWDLKIFRSIRYLLQKVYPPLFITDFLVVTKR